MKRAGLVSMSGAADAAAPIGRPITLTSGESRCVIHPDLGGCLGDWTVGRQAMFRPAGDGAVAAGDPLGMSSFPLVPYSNRIGRAAFPWRGERVALTPNFPPEPHAIHGVGWRRRWSIVEQTQASARIVYVHASDSHWPWAFTAEQHVTLGPTSLTFDLSARNDAREPAPLAFGHHPYFDRAGAQLKFDAAAVWLPGEDGLPSERASPFGDFDFHARAPVEGRDIDHVFDGWSGRARIAWDGRPLALDIVTSPSLSRAVVYIPKGGDAFCFEPVAHVSNALNLAGRAAPMPIIEPGEAFSARIAFSAAPTA